MHPFAPRVGQLFGSPAKERRGWSSLETMDGFMAVTRRHCVMLEISPRASVARSVWPPRSGWPHDRRQQSARGRHRLCGDRPASAADVEFKAWQCWPALRLWAARLQQCWQASDRLLGRTRRSQRHDQGGEASAVVEHSSRRQCRHSHWRQPSSFSILTRGTAVT